MNPILKKLGATTGILGEDRFSSGDVDVFGVGTERPVRLKAKDAAQVAEMRPIPVIEEKTLGFSLSADECRKVLKLLPFMAGEKSRFAFNGVCLDSVAGLAVATDGKVLGAVDLPGTWYEPRRRTVVTAIALEIGAIAGGLHVGDDRSWGEGFTAMNLQAAFPDVRQVVAGIFETGAVVEFDRREFLDAVEGAAMLTPEGKARRAAFIEDDTAGVYGRSKARTAAVLQESFDSVTIEAAEFGVIMKNNQAAGVVRHPATLKAESFGPIRVNGRYLRAIGKAADLGMIRLRVSADNKPMAFQVGTVSGAVMPIVVRNPKK